MKPLHHKTHTFAKRGLSLLCVLALCLSLLPVTALAAAVDAPQTLYVAGQAITEEGYYTQSGGSWTKSSDTSIPPSEPYFHYTKGSDNTPATLTLSGATIKGGSDVASIPYGAGIYAQCSNGQSVTLTIKLIGENTITGTFGIYVNAEMNASSYGTNATLTIVGDNNGSLEVSGSNNGIYVKSGTGGASLNINDASVVASSSSSYSGYDGVYVQSSAHATSSPQLSLAVNGGSLTASGGDSGAGIQFNVGSSGDIGATTSLTISDNAIVRAENGINAYRVDKPTPSGTGIVFDDKEGTVYGNVTLQENITINEGESLTIGDGASLIVPNGKTLTNNGTVTTEEGGTLTNNGKIDNSGTLPDNIQGSAPPKITTTSLLPGGTVNAAYSQTLAATGDNITWSSSDLPNWLTLNRDGTISGTPTAAGASIFTVTATNDSGSDSKQLTLTVTQPVTGVMLDQSELALYTGGSATLSATVTPENATNTSLTWASDAENIATVDQSGNVKAVGAGTATITATAADGSGISATCTVTVTDKTYTISADATVLNFGSAYTGYTQPAAQTVTVKNTGNQPVTLIQPASTNSFEVGTLSTTNLAVGETATFTVQPKAGLSAGTYSDTITVSDTNNNVTVTIPASFTVKSQPSYNPPTVSEETADAIQDAQPGETVTVDLSSGSTKLDKEVFETLAGKDVTLVVDLGDDVSWTVKGSDVPEDADFTDIDLGVTMNSDGIPVDVVNAISGERSSVQITLAHDGEFGFTMTLTAPLGKENAGYWANLYHYKVNGGEADREDPLGDDEDAEALNFEAAAKIDEDGSVTIPFTHASQYAIVIDDHSHATVPVSDIFIDIAPNAWYTAAVQYAYDNGLMTGVSDTEFAPEATTTRAMIVSILARLEGVESAQAAGFADVDDEWYATAVNWAANVGVVNGYEDNTFQPNTAITREQLAAMLMNYASYKGQDVSARASLDNYTDQPSTWAEETMQWAVAEGLISGVTADTLQPQGAATRAQVAAILQRFLSE